MVRLIKALAASTWSTSAAVTVVSAVGIAISVTAFDLRVSGAISLYFLIWWTLLFAILPFGVRSQDEAGEVMTGSEPGAPAAPRLREKALWNTLLSSPLLVFVAGTLPLAGL